MALPVNFRDLDPPQLLEALSLHIYNPPLSKVREHWDEHSDAICVPILILDFDTEVQMQGILGFLENSTGLFLPQTISAFRIIGAHETASTLAAIETTMKRHGVTPATLRGDFEGATEFEVTSFKELHGPKASIMAKEVQEIAKSLYFYDKDQARIMWECLDRFVETNHDELISEIERILKSG